MLRKLSIALVCLLLLNSSLFFGVGTGYANESNDLDSSQDDWSNGEIARETIILDENGNIVEEQTSEEENNKKESNQQKSQVLTNEEEESQKESDDQTEKVENTQKSEEVQLQTFSVKEQKPTIKYSTHVQSHGWLEYVNEGKMSGTEGEAKRLEAIKIQLENAPENSGIEYRTHVQSYGWQDWKKNNQLSGTQGEAKRLEAIQIKLTGDIEKQYDVYYRVHAQTYGWLDWAKNGESAGTAGLAKRLEAIEIVLVKKGEKAPGSTKRPFVVEPSIKYSTHVQSYGWMKDVKDGKMSGTEGEAKRLEAIKIQLENAPYSGNVEYRTHVQTYGWLKKVKNGAISGTSGEKKRMEAIQINLTGDMAKHYDIYYRVHAQTYGWLDWAKNGESAGTQGLAKRLEAIEIVLVEKGGKAPGSTKNPFVVVDPSVAYSTHVESHGWMKEVTDGKMSGTSGEAKRLEAIKIRLKNAPYSGNIEYRTHVQTYGWLNWEKNGATSGTSGEKKRMEAIQIKLTGDMAKYYDIYYRVHAQSFGWLGWAKNGESAGTEGLAKRLEAIEIVLVEKGGKAPGSTEKSFLQPPSVSYTTHVKSDGWLKSVKDGKTAGNPGSGKQIEAIKVSLNHAPYDGAITYRTHVQKEGWLGYVSNGKVSGTTGEGKRVEAVQIKLTGDMAKYYDVYYRAYVSSFGWLGWARNGMKAGTEGYAKPIEALEIKLFEKGKGPKASETTSYKGKFISYTNYSLSLNEAVNIQMKAKPQTDSGTITQKKKYAWVSKEYVKDNVITADPEVNVRKGPGTGYASMDKLPKGTKVNILSEYNGWYAIEYSHRTWVHAISDDVKYYLNPGNFKDGTNGFFQFIKLSKPANIDADEVNSKILKGKGILEGKASTFIQAGKKYNVNEVYLMAHSLLETGNGKSDLASGKIKVGEIYYNADTGEGKWVVFLPNSTHTAEYKDFTPNDKKSNKEWRYARVFNFDKSKAKNIKTTYNMYGIGAVDESPHIRGSIRAYQEGWFKPETAIVEGAKFIAESYIHAGQDTLYKMRWNPQAMVSRGVATNQYATDIGWAVKQTNKFKEFYDMLENYTLEYDVPKYK